MDLILVIGAVVVMIVAVVRSQPAHPIVYVLMLNDVPMGVTEDREDAEQYVEQCHVPEEGHYVRAIPFTLGVMPDHRGC